MNIYKLINYITFMQLLTTNEELISKYNTIISQTLDFPKNSHKKTILAYLFILHTEIKIFLKENNTLLSRKEKKYIKALKNLIMQFRRYLSIQSSKEFPLVFVNLGEKEFKLGIEELSKEKKISKEILLLDKPFVFDFKISQPKRKGINPFKK